MELLVAFCLVGLPTLLLGRWLYVVRRFTNCAYLILEVRDLELQTELTGQLKRLPKSYAMLIAYFGGDPFCAMSPYAQDFFNGVEEAPSTEDE